MKLSAFVVLAAATFAIASPATGSLNRGFKVVRAEAGVAEAQYPCVECPCEGFTGVCKCIPNGCCCK